MVDKRNARNKFYSLKIFCSKFHFSFSVGYKNMSTIQLILFSIWVFLSRIFTNHRGAREGGGHFFNFSQPFAPALQTFRHSQMISAGRSSLHVVRSWARAGNPWFPSASR